MKLATILMLALLMSASAIAATVAVPTIEPRAEDVSTVDGIVDAFYASVQVRPTEERGWSRDKTLYSPWVRFVFLDRNGKPQAWTHQELVDATEPLIAAGFLEEEINRVVTRYGSIAHVYSTYRGTVSAKPPVEFQGVNSLQLFHDGNRWWITSVTWQSESSEQPIPAWLLRKGS